MAIVWLQFVSGAANKVTTLIKASLLLVIGPAKVITRLFILVPQLDHGVSVKLTNGGVMGSEEKHEEPV